MGFTQSCFIHIFLTFLFVSSDAEDIMTIKANKGQKIPLHCNVPEDGFNKTFTVNWKKNETRLCYYRVNNTMPYSHCGSRYVIEGRPPRLYLTNIGFNDSGVYKCSVTQVTPPPAEEKSHLVDLTVQGVEKLNSSNEDCMALQCKPEGLGKDLTFHWTWGTSRNQSENLTLCKPDWRDCGTFSCNVTYENGSFSDTFAFPECSTDINKLITIVCVVVPAGVVLIFLIICCCCKYQKRKKQETTATVFSNKIYENFSFGGSGPTTDSMRPEECIYEN